MDEGSGDDDDREADGVGGREWQLHDHHGQEGSYRAGHQHHDQRADTHGDVVVSGLHAARFGRAATFRFAGSDAASIALS